jgi:hypothetical protein
MRWEEREDEPVEPVEVVEFGKLDFLDLSTLLRKKLLRLLESVDRTLRRLGPDVGLSEVANRVSRRERRRKAGKKTHLEESKLGSLELERLTRRRDVVFEPEDLSEELKVLDGASVKTESVVGEGINLEAFARNRVPSRLEGVDSVEGARTNGRAAGLSTEGDGDLEVADGGARTRGRSAGGTSRVVRVRRLRSLLAGRKLSRGRLAEDDGSRGAEGHDGRGVDVDGSLRDERRRAVLRGKALRDYGEGRTASVGGQKGRERQRNTRITSFTPTGRP